MRLSQEEILELISQKKYADAQAELSEWNEADIASFMEDVSKVESLKIFRVLPKDMAADVFANLPLKTQQELIASLTDEETDQIIEDMYADDAADLLEEMPSNVVKRILAAANPKTRNDINQLLQYPKGSAGAIMTVICAKLIGATLPILANRIGVDPAVMANPLITTIVDAVSLLVYFEFATLMLGI